MKIKIEVDLTPSELRALIGLPDVAGLQEDMIEYLRERVSSGVEGFDPAGLLKGNLLASKTWQRLMNIAKSEAEAEEDAPPKKKRASAPSRSTSKKTTASRRTTN